MSLTPKQVRILQVLVDADDWVSRQQMESSTGKKGFSEALGAPNREIRPGSLEALGFVRRRDKPQPFEYGITNRGVAALIALGFEVPEMVRARLGDSLIDSGEELNTQVAKSQRDSDQIRRERLRNAPRLPERFLTWGFSFRRNPDVIAEALLIANGTCGSCKTPAPFIRRSDGTAYLEVHHKKTLASGGEDVVDNTIALCPNCHRKMHFG